MKLTVRAHPKSKFEAIIEHEDVFHVYFNVPPEGGRANNKIIEMLAKKFSVSKSQIQIILGKTSSEKVIEISDRGC